MAIAVSVDALIVGGGIAGLWTLARLKQAGYKAVLLEADSLGAGQTRFAQGIIHGGTKYALTGKITASSEAVADMPALWRNCFEGKGVLDLSKATLLSDAHYLWSTSSLTSRVSGFFASKVMRARTNELDKTERPELFRHADFKGQIYALDEPVFDAMSVVRAIAEPLMDSIVAIKGNTVKYDNDVLSLQSQDDQDYEFSFEKIVLTAGQGNEALLSALGLQQPEMQLRPLKMVMLRGGLSDMVFAHCMGGSVNPRITITSNRDQHGAVVWYLGGQLAEEGVERSDAEQIEQAKAELAELIPWLDQSKCQWATLDIDRAEVKKPGTKRPDTFFIEQRGKVITAWPTKMALSPLMAEHVLEMINNEKIPCVEETGLPVWPGPDFAYLPWNEETRWSM
ncbi:MAG: FAD-dependent oxidoreductase [Gammaproteobacteria bacterium]|nr:FAD-dependent oxidoreductase [Gammaproteobacteria bacterium]MCW8922101.1 FAD-dependent oxidoreductase [Gammaproteobacteria bacterium]